MSSSEILVEKLANGLTVIGEPNKAHVSAAVGFVVRTGARDETAEEAGISHFLEHMMFKGTAKRDAMKVTLDLADMAAQSNAYTSDEATVYYAVVLPEQFPAACELLCDMLRPALDPAEFDVEKKVILEEIALYLDKPHFSLYESALRSYFGGHPAGQSVIGTTASVGAISRAQMKEYFDRRYRPNNMAVIASGNFDFAQFFRDVERHCASWDAGETTRDRAPHRHRIERMQFAKRGIEQGHALLVGTGPSAQDPDRFAGALLSMILGDSSGSKLYWELIDTGLAENAHIEFDEKDGTGVSLTFVSGEPGALDTIVSKASKVLSAAADFSDDDLERAKNKLLSRIVMSGELPMGRFSSATVQWQYGNQLQPLGEISRRYQAVTRADILRVIERFSLTNLAEYRLVPE